MVVVTGEAHLFQVILAILACGRLTDFLHGRHEKGNEHGDNGDGNQ